MIEIFLCIWNMDIAQGLLTLPIVSKHIQLFYVCYNIWSRHLQVFDYQIVKVDECRPCDLLKFPEHFNKIKIQRQNSP
jgi:hypothetical protein